MKHFAMIQSEFLKYANWDSLSQEEQKSYLQRHPKSKRKLTAKPEIDQQKKESKPKKQTKLKADPSWSRYYHEDKPKVQQVKQKLDKAKKDVALKPDPSWSRYYKD